MTDVVGLRALAEAVAVEGPWAIWHDLDHQGFKTVGDAESYRQMLANGEAEDCNPVAHVYTDADAEFIAAANPSVVLALLDEITTLRAALADRDARIEAVKKWRHDWLEPPESEAYPHRPRTHVRRLDEILSSPAVPVPQDNPEATRETHDHASEPKIWCETCQHTHIASIPRFTYLCKDCGWGQWYGEQAREHEFWTQENLRVAHTTYEVEHVRRSREATTEPRTITDAKAYAAHERKCGCALLGCEFIVGWRAALEAVEASRSPKPKEQENGSES